MQGFVPFETRPLEAKRFEEAGLWETRQLGTTFKRSQSQDQTSGALAPSSWVRA